MEEAFKTRVYLIMEDQRLNVYEKMVLIAQELYQGDPSLERIAEGTSLSPSLVEMILVCLKQKQPHDPIERHLRERIAALSLYAPPPGSLPEGKTTWREIHRELIKKEVEYLHYYQEIRKQYTTHSSADRAE